MMKWIGRILLAPVVVSALGFGWWRYDHADREHAVTPEALAALESDAEVTVSREGDWTVFRPANSSPTTGLIFYPGGECDERGYAQTLRDIAAEGYLTILVPMPFQLAVFAPDRATGVIEAHPEIQTWVIGGHSLGGTMAARYTHHHPENIAGLLMWDAYPADDMSSDGVTTRLVHRSADGTSTPPDYVPHLPKFPPQTEFVPLKGGSHLNFGNFVAGRIYRNEPPPALPGDQQRDMTAQASVDFMRAL